LYSEDWSFVDDEESESRRGFRLEEKITSEKYSNCFIRELIGEQLSLEYVQKTGLRMPVLVREMSGLGMIMPSRDFTVNHVKHLVGPTRLLDVMEVATQKNECMALKDWVKYYNNPHKDRLLNVISLEFSHTQLDNFVESPTIVRLIDWVDTVWPQKLKNSQTDSTNAIDQMMYPKVQKYCLMSVKGCYTDFHIDFGGTSVWYHILKGAKVCMSTT